MTPTPNMAAFSRSSGRLCPLFRMYRLTVASAHAAGISDGRSIDECSNPRLTPRDSGTYDVSHTGRKVQGTRQCDVGDVVPGLLWCVRAKRRDMRGWMTYKDTT